MPDRGHRTTQAQVMPRLGYQGWLVVYQGRVLANFLPEQETNAMDFCNGFNAGLTEAHVVR